MKIFRFLVLALFVAPLMGTTTGCGDKVQNNINLTPVTQTPPRAVGGLPGGSAPAGGGVKGGASGAQGAD
jgi:hypothetical protein